MASRIHPTLEELVLLRLKARGFSFQMRQPVSSLLSGRYASRIRGRGLIFEELRVYRPGDDIRAMDWKATARLRKPHVRVYCEERERPVLLIVDQRTTMFFGSDRTTKATVATEVAALAGWQSLDSGDRVGALIFSDDEVVEIKPHRSQRNVLRICNELVRANMKLDAYRAPVASTTLNDALRRAINVAKHDHLVLIVTDFADADSETRELTTALAAHNDLMAVLVYDPLGASMPIRTRVTATDGQRGVSVSGGSKFHDRFEAAFRATMDKLRLNLQPLRIPILPICTHEPVIHQVLAAIGSRHRQ